MKNFTKLCCAIIAVLIVGCGSDDDESPNLYRKNNVSV